MLKKKQGFPHVASSSLSSIKNDRVDEIPLKEINKQNSRELNANARRSWSPISISSEEEEESEMRDVVTPDLIGEVS